VSEKDQKRERDFKPQLSLQVLLKITQQI